MGKNPKFSIIVPVYNVENYLSKCLDSIINQTLLDIEIICVDDGSKDNSYNILLDYAKWDLRLQIVRKENGGLSSARNAGMNVAKGNYICFVDSDDYIENNFCERLYVEVLEHNPDIIVFGANIFPMTKETDPWTYSNLSPNSQHFKKFEPDILLSYNRGYPFVWRNCFKKIYLDKISLTFDEKIKFGEDTVFQVCAFPGARNIVYIGDKLYNYRYDRKNSLMFSSRRDDSKRLRQHLEIIQAIAIYWKDMKYLPKWNNLFSAFALDFMGDDLLRYKNMDKGELVESLFKTMSVYELGVKLKTIPSKYRSTYMKLKYYEKITRLKKCNNPFYGKTS